MSQWTAFFLVTTMKTSNHTKSQKIKTPISVSKQLQLSPLLTCPEHDMREKFKSGLWQYIHFPAKLEELYLRCFPPI
jgi:hypothetical protein